MLLVQARPITALPDEVRWDDPEGGWLRNFRIGEWLGDPVTPSQHTNENVGCRLSFERDRAIGVASKLPGGGDALAVDLALPSGGTSA